MLHDTPIRKSFITQPTINYFPLLPIWVIFCLYHRHIMFLLLHSLDCLSFYTICRHRVKSFCFKFYMTLYNEEPLMDYIHIGPDGRYGSKILTSSGDKSYEWNLERMSNSSQSTHPTGRVLWVILQDECFGKNYSRKLYCILLPHVLLKDKCMYLQNEWKL